MTDLHRHGGHGLTPSFYMNWTQKSLQGSYRKLAHFFVQLGVPWIATLSSRPPPFSLVGVMQKYPALTGVTTRLAREASFRNS